MEFISLGGIFEHGRNCFCIKGNKKQILLDCGEGETGDLPSFDLIDVSKVDALFVSHSHLDHTGAIKSLIEKGFKGNIYLSKPTYDCLSYKPSNVVFLKPNEELVIDSTLKVLPRRSGHCFGSLSFQIEIEDKTVLYTGDYLESNVFKCDYLRDVKADLAIVDSAYTNEKNYLENKLSLSFLLFKLIGKTILPLPKNGRNMDIISLLNENDIPYHLLNANFFIEEENVYLKNKVEIKDTEDADVILIQDPQLENKESKRIVDEYNDANIIFTGTIDEGSYSDYLFKNRKNCYFSRINVHQDREEAVSLVSKNDFKNVIYFHNKELDDKKELVF